MEDEAGIRIPYSGNVARVYTGYYFQQDSAPILSMKKETLTGLRHFFKC